MTSFADAAAPGNTRMCEGSIRRATCFFAVAALWTAEGPLVDICPAKGCRARGIQTSAAARTGGHDLSPRLDTEILRAAVAYIANGRQRRQTQWHDAASSPLSTVPTTVRPSLSAPPAASNVWQQRPAWNCAQRLAVTSPPRSPQRRTDCTELLPVCCLLSAVC
jgi:hypothetical protein